MSLTLIEGGIVLTSDPAQPLLQPGYVLIENGIIKAVGEGTCDTPDIYQRIDASNKLVIPGLINAHTHLCMTLGRSLGADRSLLQWLTEAQVPFMSQMTAEDHALAVKLGAIENLKAGNTTICEIFFSARYPDGADSLAAQALDEVGIRALFFRCSSDEEFAPGFIESTTDIDKRSQELIKQWQTHDKIDIGVGPLVPWTATEEYWADTCSLRDTGISVHLHTAETPDYNGLMLDRSGLSNVGFLADRGVLNEKVMLNHCVFLDDADIEAVADSGASVIHDPTSNMFLASGIAPILKMRKAGITVGLACDGPACNNTQDMFEVMKDAALLQKVTTCDATALTARDVFAMATIDGARACGMEDKIGSLTAGKHADITIIDTLASHLSPIHDPFATLVYSVRAADVETVLVGGRVVVAQGKIQTIDQLDIIHQAQKRAVELRQAAKLD
jgi:5-methylthioadenosine/S-adenosylhomocysteine deaminase